MPEATPTYWRTVESLFSDGRRSTDLPARRCSPRIARLRPAWLPKSSRPLTADAHATRFLATVAWKE